MIRHDLVDLSGHGRKWMQLLLRCIRLLDLGAKESGAGAIFVRGGGQFSTENWTFPPPTQKKKKESSVVGLRS